MLEMLKTFTTRVRYYIGYTYIAIMPFKRLFQLGAIAAVLASGALTAALTYSALTALFTTLTVLFPALTPLTVPMHIVSSISALALGAKAAYETAKFLWQKASRWGQNMDNWLIKFLAGQPYYLTTVKQHVDNCEQIILKVEDNINHMERIFCRMDDYLAPSPIKHPYNSRQSVLNVLRYHISQLSQNSGLITPNSKTVIEQLGEAARYNEQAKSMLIHNQFYIPLKEELEKNPSIPVKKNTEKITDLFKKIADLKQRLQTKLEEVAKNDQTVKVPPETQQRHDWLTNIVRRIDVITTIIATIEKNLNLHSSIELKPILYRLNRSKEIMTQLQDDNSTASDIELNNVKSYLRDLQSTIDSYDSYIRPILQKQVSNSDQEQQTRSLLNYMKKNIHTVNKMIAQDNLFKPDLSITQLVGKFSALHKPPLPKQRQRTQEAIVYASPASPH